MREHYRKRLEINTSMALLLALHSLQLQQECLLWFFFCFVDDVTVLRFVFKVEKNTDNNVLVNKKRL